MRRSRPVVLIMAVAAGAAWAQDAVTARSAAELLAELRARGVALPDGLSIAEDGSVVLPLPAAGEMTPAVPATPAQAGTTTGQLADGPAPQPESDPAVEWKNRAEVSFGLSDGNTESTDLRLAYVGVRETEVDKLRLDGSYYFQKDEDETRENEATAGFLYDHDIGTSRWLWFADGRWDWDEFESWDHRVGGHVGLGYKLIDRDDLRVVLRAGAGAVREFGGERDEWIPEALAGADVDWEISERHALEASFRYLPDLDEGGEFRTLTDVGWVMGLDVEKGLSLTAGLAHEYQSQVDAGVEESDLKLYAGLGLDF